MLGQIDGLKFNNFVTDQTIMKNESHKEAIAQFEQMVRYEQKSIKIISQLVEELEL